MRLDPRAKLWLYACGTVAALLTNRPVPLLVLLVPALLAVFSAGGARRWVGVLGLLAPMLVLLAIFSALGGDWRDAATPVLKLLTLGTLAAALFASVNPDELSDALALLRLPQGLGFILVGGLRYAPTVRASWSALADSQRARGAVIPRGIVGLPAYGRLLAPAVVRALRTADDMAEAMEARGFGSQGMTMMADYRLRVLDWSLMALALAGMVGYLVWLV